MKDRLLSLDIFRGITLAGMILVNTSGNGTYTYAPLQHADWHGFTPTDLVFPSFLFMVGVAMRYAFKKYDYQWSSELRNKILKRTILLYLINFVIFHFPFLDLNLERFRVLGVLPRIALSYCLVSILVLKAKPERFTWYNAGFLLAFWLIMWVFGDAGVPYELGSNAVLKLDLFLFGPNHLYHGEGIAFDPEGLLSTLPALSTCLFGYQAAMYLQAHRDTPGKIIKQFLTAGLAFLIVAHLWDLAFPINKKLWTSSFVLNCVGWDLILLGLIYHWVDVKGKALGNTFFLVFGTNSILAYGVSDLLAIHWGRLQFSEGDGTMDAPEWTYWHLFEPLFGKYNGSLAYAITFMLICWLICYVFYRKKIFLKV